MMTLTTIMDTKILRNANAWRSLLSTFKKNGGLEGRLDALQNACGSFWFIKPNRPQDFDHLGGGDVGDRAVPYEWEHVPRHRTSPLRDVLSVRKAARCRTSKNPSNASRKVTTRVDFCLRHSAATSRPSLPAARYCRAFSLAFSRETMG
jgi:hypothetical protein